MSKRTYQPNNRRRHKVHGFRLRMRTRAGRASCPRAAARAARAWPSDGRSRRRARPLVLPAAHRLTDGRVLPAGGPSRAPGRVAHARRPPRAPDAGGRPAPRVGFVVSKAVGNAVVRNRVQAPAPPPRPGAARVAPGLCACSWSGRCPAAATASSAELGADLDALPAAGDVDEVDRCVVLIGLLRGLPPADQPALRPGLPLPPVLLGVRAGGGDAPTAACAAAGSPSAGWPAATRGPPAATTRSRPAPPRRHARRQPTPARSLSDRLLQRHRQLHHDAAVLRDLRRSWSAVPQAVRATFGWTRRAALPGRCRSSA